MCVLQYGVYLSNPVPNIAHKTEFNSIQPFPAVYDLCTYDMILH
jgi:hypothetical protein